MKDALEVLKHSELNLQHYSRDTYVVNAIIGALCEVVQSQQAQIEDLVAWKAGIQERKARKDKNAQYKEGKL